ncbi:uncharacterized protein LOC144429754 [Styela clava]
MKSEIGILWWIFIMSYSITLTRATICTDCPNEILGTESKNIKYGPSNEYNCNCDWTIPTSMDTDHEAAVVLLLQNVSLPIDTKTSSSAECSGEIRVPSTDAYKCDFTSNYCLTFATASTICNITKIREKIPVANYTCDSIIPWNNAGGSPYKIEYYAKNSAGYTKYFTIQYLVIDCRLPTTTQEAETTTYENTTVITQSLSTEIIRSSAHDITENHAHSEDDFTGVSTNPAEATSVRQVQVMNTTTIIIIAASVLGLAIVVVSALILRRRCRRDNNDISSTNEEGGQDKADGSSEREIVDNAIYGTSLNNQQGSETIINEIYDPTLDADGEKTNTDEICLYAVVQKKEKTEDKNVVTEGNDDIATVEDEPSSIYAVVNKDKK